MFISGAIIAADLTTLIYKYLNAEDILTPFLSKVFFILLVFVGVFAYYAKDYANYWQSHRNERKYIEYFAMLSIAGVLIATRYILGPPKKQKIIKNDLQRVGDLQQLESLILGVYRDTDTLPQNLEELVKYGVYPYLPKDPETFESYKYEKLGNKEFKLCAKFKMPFPELPGEGDPLRLNWRIKDLKNKKDKWDHEAGELCFKRDVSDLINVVNKYPRVYSPEAVKD
jgi:hypothetical protein